MKALMLVALLAAAQAADGPEAADESRYEGFDTYSELLDYYGETFEERERFNCKAGNIWWDDEPVVLILSIDERSEASTGVGRVEVAGVTYIGMYDVTGANRRWAFGWSEERDQFDYAFIMEPGGAVHYVDFSRVEPGESASTSQRYVCQVRDVSR